MGELEVPIEIKESVLAKAIAEVVAEKQKRIDRLEQLILDTYKSVCHGEKVGILADDDRETVLCVAIIDEYNKLKDEQQD